MIEPTETSDEVGMIAVLLELARQIGGKNKAIFFLKNPAGRRADIGYPVSCIRYQDSDVRSWYHVLGMTFQVLESGTEIR